MPNAATGTLWDLAWAAASLVNADWPLVPVCMWCERVAIGSRDGRERWEHVPMTIRSTFRHRNVAQHLTHGICPACLERNSPRRLGIPPRQDERPVTWKALENSATSCRNLRSTSHLSPDRTRLP